MSSQQRNFRYIWEKDQCLPNQALSQGETIFGLSPVKFFLTEAPYLMVAFAKSDTPPFLSDQSMVEPQLLAIRSPDLILAFLTAVLSAVFL